MASGTSLQLSGLASGFDWKSFTDQIMAIERRPADVLVAEQASNERKSDMLATLGTKLETLQVAAKALKAKDLFAQRTAKSGSSGSTWDISAGVTTAPGVHEFNVTQLATTARKNGAADAGQALNPTSDDVSGLTVGTLKIGKPVTAGTFTVNGSKVNVALTDSLQDVLTAIGTATGGDVTATYDHLSDKISLVSASGTLEIGAGNDTSNFLRSMKLSNGGGGSAISATKLGNVSLSNSIDSANLSTPVAASTGSFKINGVSIAYDAASDSISAVLARVTASSAGVTASYDSVNDRFLLTNKSTGDSSISVTDDTGGLMASLGLMSGGSFTQGKDALFTVNGGPEISAASNTLSESDHGIAGLSIKTDSVGTQNVTVSADTGTAKTAIETFISKYNDVQDYIDTVTKITRGTGGKVTSAALANNREVQDWSHSLRTIAFAQVSGSSGAMRLESMGVDFTTGTNKLAVKDADKFASALADSSADVANFFQSTSVGFAAKFESFITKATDLDSEMQARITKKNSEMDTQIGVIERRMEQERARMEAAFIKMESAQSSLKSQQSALSKAFSSSSS